MARGTGGQDPLVEEVLADKYRSPSMPLDRSACHSRPPSNLCRYGDPANSPATVYGLGDSFIYVLGTTLRDESAQRGWAYIHDSQSGCPWIKGMKMVVHSEIKDINRVRRQGFWDN